MTYVALELDPNVKTADSVLRTESASSNGTEENRAAPK
jgi:hypothetical protein